MFIKKRNENNFFNYLMRNFSCFHGFLKYCDAIKELNGKVGYYLIR